MYRCTDACELDWDKIAKFMVEIWTGRRFSFLRESWYHADMCQVVMNFGSCGCIPFNAMQLACYAKQVDSINRLLALNCSTWVVKEEVFPASSYRQDARKITVRDPHPNPTYFHYLKFIVKKEYQIRVTAPECALVKKRKDHNDTAETVADCLNAIFTSKYRPLCTSVRQQSCVCDTFIQAYLNNTLSADVLLLLGKYPKKLWPRITLGVGVDFTETDPAIFRVLNKPQIIISIFEDQASNTIHFYWGYYYAHGRFYQKILTIDSVTKTNNRVKDLTKLFVESTENFYLLEFFLLATNDKRLIIGGGEISFFDLVIDTQKIIIERGEGEALFEDLKSVHFYFQPVPSLFSLCRKVINRNLAYPYHTSMASLSIPDVIKNRVLLD